MTTTKDRHRARRLRAWKIAHGVCVGCPASARPARRMCARCAAYFYRAKKRSEARAKRKETPT